ncbi:MAG TPA: cyclic peptide export ABC transporter [Pyrinomonadaceae bacterium]
MKVIKDFVRVSSFLMRVSKNIRYPRMLIAIAVGAGIISGLANTALLAVINSTLTGGSAASHAVWTFGGLCLLLPISRYFSNMLLIGFTERAMSDLRLQLCRQILGTRLRTLEELGSHRLLGTLTGDVPTIASALTVLPFLCMHLAITLGCFAYLAYLSLPVFIGVLIFLTLAVISYRLPLTWAFRHLKRGRDAWDVLLKHFHAVTEGAKELQLHWQRREAFLNGNLHGTTRMMEKANVKGNAIFTAASSWGQTMFFVLIGLILFVLPTMQTVSLQTLTGYTLTLLYVIVPLEILINRLPDISRASIAVSKIEQLGITENDATSLARGNEPASVNWKTLELAGVEHTYYLEKENCSFTLGPINLSLRMGELVFLTGGNGSGKTTLAKLLMGLYLPESGELMIDGQTVTAENRETFRQSFSAVFSDYFLFDSLLGVTGTEADTRAETYLRELQLNHKVEIKDGVFSTTDLSAGQRKRLALLTVYMEDRPVYIFDEWAADQDPQFKETFYYQLLPELKSRGKLVIVISHDDRYYHIADRIIKLDYGKVEYDSDSVLMPEALGELPAQFEERETVSTTY